MWIADMDYVHLLYAQCLKMTGIMMMNICAVVKSSWSFVWLQELGIFTLILESKTWLGEGGSGDAMSSVVQSCHQVSSVSHWPLAVFAEMALLLTAARAPMSLSVSSSKLLHISLEPLSVLRCPRASDALAIGCSWCCVDLGVSCTCCRHSRAGTKLWHCFPFRRDTSEGVGSSIDLLQSHSLA